MQFDLLSQLPKTSQGGSQQQTMPSDASWQELSEQTPPSIRHSNEDGGLIMVWLADPSRARPGVSSMHNMSEHAHSLGPSPNDDAVCSLSSVLEPPASIPQRFYLTAKACAGILRRAEKRGKALPPMLHRALSAVAGE